MIDSQQASRALAEIDEVVRRVRQSRIYQLASLLMIMWGALVFVGNVASFGWPRYAGYIWIAVNVAGVAGSFAISVLTLIGYFFVGGWFEPWMTFVNGGGLMLGGLWMRRS